MDTISYNVNVLKWCTEVMHLQPAGETKMSCTRRTTDTDCSCNAVNHKCVKRPKKKKKLEFRLTRRTWTEEGCIVGSVLDGGVSAVKQTQLSWLGRGGE